LYFITRTILDYEISHATVWRMHWVIDSAKRLLIGLVTCCLGQLWKAINSLAHIFKKSEKNWNIKIFIWTMMKNEMKYVLFWFIYNVNRRVGGRMRNFKINSAGAQDKVQ